MQNLPLSLDGEWRLSGRREPQKAHAVERFDGAEFKSAATVPGNLELELFRAGRVEEPYFAMNAMQLRPYEFYEWIFTRTFDYEGQGGETELYFEGLDCFGTVFLNGVKLGDCANALVPHSFDTAGVLRQGENRLSVHIASANNRFADYPMSAVGFSSYPFNYEVTRIRKPAHSWGWDIAPRTALGGLFRSVSLRERSPSRLMEGYLQTLSVAGGRALLRYSYRIATTAMGDAHLRIRIEGECGESKFCREEAVWSYQGVVTFPVQEPKLWNVRHYGEPNLYQVKVTLLLGEQVLFQEDFTAGIRTVELKALPVCTDSGEPDFQFIVNDRPVRVFGSNHVPADALHSRDSERLGQVLDIACELECNIIRVWGGGVYELPEFYDRCDREGILVWQDFMMGCAIYPNDPEFCETIRCEAVQAVKLLRQHPSLALWAGDNECDCVPSWANLTLDPNTNKLTREVLPAVCREHDPVRPYLPSSPWYSPEAVDKASCGDPASFAPEQHLWGPRDYFKSDFYRNTRASFLSETGYHGSPAALSIRKFIPEDKVWPYRGNPYWYYHASNPFLADHDGQNFRVDIMGDQIMEFFGFEPEDLETFALASQICQMEAVKYLIELFRSNPKRSGLIWWNLIDCWPQFSDAVTDYYGVRKLACPIIRRVQQGLLVMVSEADRWERGIVVANDSNRDERGSYQIRNADTGEIFAAGRFDAPAGQVIVAECVRVNTTHQALLLIEWRTDHGVSGCNHYVSGYPLFDFIRFRDAWLPAIAGLDGSFDPKTIAQ